MKKPGLYLLLALPWLLCGCYEDDVYEIFASGQTWHWSASYDTTDWENDNKYTITISQSDLQSINENQDNYIVQFSEDGTVAGQGKSFTFSGTWSADAEDHSFSVNLQTNRTPSGLDQTFYNEIANAKFYRGDSKTIKLFNADRNHYIQFYVVGFKN